MLALSRHLSVIPHHHTDCVRLVQGTQAYHFTVFLQYLDGRSGSSASPCDISLDLQKNFVLATRLGSLRWEDLAILRLSKRDSLSKYLIFPSLSF